MWQLPVLDGMRLLHAYYVKHSFAPHAHDHYVIGLIERGVQQFDHGKRRFVTLPQHIIVLNPDEVHTGEAAIQGGFGYRAMYPSKSLMAALASELNGRQQPVFSSARVYDPQLYQRLSILHAATSRDPLPLAIEVELGEALLELLVAHAALPAQDKRSHRVRREVKRVQDYVQQHYADNISLQAMANLVNISPYHFARLFREQTGLPPHRYLENVRIQQAQAQLERGKPIAQVAFDTGFTSQSHLNRTFKRILGITPGRYAKMRKIV